MTGNNGDVTSQADPRSGHPGALVTSPGGPLGSYVERLWFSAGPMVAGREHALPSGQMHLALRLDGVPLRVYSDKNDRIGRLVGDSSVSGARAGFYVKDTATSRVVGAQLRPGASMALFGVSATELAGTHTPLSSLFDDAVGLRDELRALDDPSVMLRRVEVALATRLNPVRAVHPDIAAALERWQDAGVIRDVVAASGWSHRHFSARFRDATGLTPKRYALVGRFRRLLRAARRQPDRRWASLAVEAGYSDQAHMTREFTAFTGLSPGEYRRVQPVHALHLPVGRGVSDR